MSSVVSGKIQRTFRTEAGMKRASVLLTALFAFSIIVGCARAPEEAITVFAGAASKVALDEAATAFENRSGIKVYANYGGSGAVLSQMKLSRSGDVYMPGSPDYLAVAERDGIIRPDSTKIVSYLVPIIAVQHGNPRNVQSLSDLARPGIKVAIGNPEAVCVGLYAVEIFDHNHLLTEVGRNIVTEAESCEKVATLISLKSVDAAIGWHVFHDWDPDSIDAVYLKPEQLPRIAYIPAAISTYARDSDSAQKFIDFLVSSQGQDIFRKWGYITTEAEARKFAPAARIGGEYRLPEAYRSLLGK